MFSTAPLVCVSESYGLRLPCEFALHEATSIFGPVHLVVGSKLEYASGLEDLHCFKLKKQIWGQFQMNLVYIDILSPR